MSPKVVHIDIVKLRWCAPLLYSSLCRPHQATALRPSNWASLAIGTGMAGGHAYVAWSESGTPDGPWRLDSYSMASLGKLSRVFEFSCISLE